MHWARNPIGFGFRPRGPIHHGLARVTSATSGMAPRSDHTLQADPVLLLSMMDEEMALRGFARATKRLYLAHARRFLAGRTREAGARSRG